MNPIDQLGPDDGEDTEVTITAGGRTAHTTLGRLAAVPEFGSGELVPEGEGYRLSADVEAVAKRILDRDQRFAHIRAERIRVGFAMQVGKKPEGKGGMHVLARAVKAPALWRDLGVFEVVLWANEEAWTHLTDRQHEALISHELCHVGGRNDQGAVQLLEHDIEEFGWIVRTYGQWHQGLEFFAQQLGLGLAPGEPVR